MEAWVPDFILGRRFVQRVVVWLWLLGFPLEYWVSLAIMAITVEAGNPFLLFILLIY